MGKSIQSFHDFSSCTHVIPGQGRNLDRTSFACIPWVFIENIIICVNYPGKASAIASGTSRIKLTSKGFPKDIKTIAQVFSLLIEDFQ